MTPKPFKVSLGIAIIASVSSLLISPTEGKSTRKVYTKQEREADEVRIREDVESKLDWRNRSKETLDDYDDERRLLYGKLNESILLRSATGERFGIYESFDQANTKRFEIRLHKRDKVTDRFLSGSIFCDAIAISADKVAREYVLFREICYRNNIPTQTLYLFDGESRNFYWVYSNEVSYTKKPAVAYKNGVYRIKWDVKALGTETERTVVRNFKLTKAQRNRWEVKPLAPINSEADNVAAEERVPNDDRYDLPSFVATWGKH